MTKEITKKPIIATIAATIILGTVLIASNTLTNNVVAQTVLPSSPCPPDGEVQHWDKIVFQIKGDDSKTIPKDMLKKTLDLKILDTPEEVVDLEQEVKNAVGVKFGVDPADLKIKIIDVLYQTVTCAAAGPPGEIGPAGPSVLPTTIHLNATGSLTGSPFTIPGLETSITVGSSNQIYISATTEADNTSSSARDAGIALLIDGTHQQDSPLSKVASGGITTNTVHWSGSLTAGTHSISVINTVFGSYCKEFNFDRCHMDILIFE